MYSVYFVHTFYVDYHVTDDGSAGKENKMGQMGQEIGDTVVTR